MELLKDIPVKLRSADISQRLRLKEKDSPDEVQDLIEVTQPLIAARAVYRVSFVEAKHDNAVSIDGVRLTSRVLRKNLDPVQRVFPFVITIGGELEARAAASNDLLRQYYMDSTGDLALKIALEYLEGHLRSRYALGQLSKMNPGSLKDWPIEEQRPLFAILGDVDKAIGVRLTRSLLMIPRKSVSGIYFPTEISFQSCMLCPRERCPSRRAGYDEGLAKKYGILE